MKKLFTLFFVFAVCMLSFAQLSGDYYIPQGSNPQGYSTLAAAIADLNANGCSGTVYFYIDGDLAETGSNLFITRSDLSSSNNLVIKAAPTKTPTITITGCAPSSSSGTQADTAKRQAGLTFVSAKYITIDGSNTVGGATKDLTILMNDGTNGIQAINFWGNCDYNVVKNIKIIYSSIPTSTSTRGIYCNGQWIGVTDSLLVQNNSIGDGILDPYYAVSVTGYSTGLINATKIYVRGNILFGRLRPMYFFRVGTAGSISEISGNTIAIANAPATGNVTWGTLLNTYGGTINFFKNKINKIRQASSTTEGVYGVGTLTGAAGVELNIYNNFLGGDFDHTGTGTPASIDVLSFQDAPAGAIVRVFHNTVVLNSMTKTASTRMTAMRFNPALGSVFDIKNNIFINNKDAAVAYGLRFDGTTTTFVSDFNDIFVSGVTANVGYSNGAARPTLLAWQTATSQDPNSQSFAVTFISSTDLHLACSFPTCNPLLLCSPVGIADDIDGDPRLSPPAGPYMGADENHPLPVELSAFNAKVMGNSVSLSWRTETEINSSMFVVERFNNNVWNVVEQITAAGNSNSPKDYSYVDKDLASGKYQYRLKMIDADGSYQYSKIVEAEITLPTEFSLSQNYPNPFNPTTQINYSLPFDTEVRLDVYTSNGELVRTLVNEAQSAGSHTVEFNASDLASGTYIYRMIAKDFVQTRKMILIK